MASIVSLRAFAIFSGIPIAAVVDKQQEYLPAFSVIDQLAAYRRGVLNYSCDAGMPIAFETRVDVPASEIDRDVSEIGSLYGDTCETGDWIASIQPRRLGKGNNAGG